MPFIPYHTSEILMYFDAINCIQDVQVISDYLNDNADDYTMAEIVSLKRLLIPYIDLFTALL